MRQFIRQHRVLTIGLVATIAVLAFLAFRPDKLFVDDVVDESLADAFASVQATTTTTGPTTTAPPSSATTAPTTTAPPSSATTAPTTTAPPSSATTAPTTTAPPSSTTTSPVTTTTSTVPEPAQPAAISTGGFYGIGHSASGTATIYELGGRYVLRFEDDTDIQNGPDLYVWVLPSEDYESGAIGEHIDLGKLKGNVGGQNYELPASFDPSVHRSVLIWCERFRVPFAAVPLSDV